ncbi:hypothetical protein [Methylobacterium radiotolerans]|uniref:Uncharacterized protein n=1 Tax=Methylobacterium radiotolerans (strain ATCC 27329 / DSM 1819 / JCM 2831 / NBRC 15690 / NCIMB 10815 / 0-1) TaxID=426355 RepID=B1M1R3_METRJ|nr:hypothetical protein [Methylobacterium radiotolerans]ACB27646.1 hypothetical protein Mrad2831_5701 [Methylobacterium radiotolerans JCM 2831]GEM95910.1 hypothetical protein MRA01_04500 [Methylobacterium radiotolerans]
MLLKRIVLRWLLSTRPTGPAPARVHRGEHELSVGAANLGAPTGPIAKLSRADAERLLGIPVRILR